MEFAQKAFVWVSLLAAVRTVQTTAAGSGTCLQDGSNAATCCKPTPDTYCSQIKASDIVNQSGDFGVCVWINLAGQTPDSNAINNAPNINNFACGGTKGDCNFANTEAAKASAAVTGASAYYGMVKGLNGANFTEGATTASSYYKSFNVALSRYNCEEQYSHWNCDDCRKAYARWACAMTMPACTSAPCGEQKPCVRVCNEVVQKCPVTLGFTCPDDNRDYSESGCNNMGLTAGAGTTPVPLFMMLTLAFVAASFTRTN